MKNLVASLQIFNASKERRQLPNLIVVGCKLGAAIQKFRLEVCKMKKSKIHKLCQDIGLDEVFLEKLLRVRLDF